MHPNAKYRNTARSRHLIQNPIDPALRSHSEIPIYNKKPSPNIKPRPRPSERPRKPSISSHIYLSNLYTHISAPLYHQSQSNHRYSGPSNLKRSRAPSHPFQRMRPPVRTKSRPLGTSWNTLMRNESLIATSTPQPTADKPRSISASTDPLPPSANNLQTRPAPTATEKRRDTDGGAGSTRLAMRRESGMSLQILVALLAVLAVINSHCNHLSLEPAHPAQRTKSCLRLTPGGKPPRGSGASPFTTASSVAHGWARRRLRPQPLRNHTERPVRPARPLAAASHSAEMLS